MFTCHRKTTVLIKLKELEGNTRFKIDLLIRCVLIKSSIYFTISHYFHQEVKVSSGLCLELVSSIECLVSIV